MRLLAALLVVLLVGSTSGVAASNWAVDRVDAETPPSETATALAADTETDTNVTSATESNATVRENTVMHIELRENGDARWNVTARYVLADANETEAFRELVAEYEAGRADGGLDSKTFERVVERVDDETDRPMELREVGRSAEIRNNGTVGVLSLSFTWTNFTQVEEDRIVLSDAFQVGSRTWLPALSEDQTLVIDGPDGYIVEDSPPNKGVTNINLLRYEGPTTFESGEIRASYIPRSNPSTVDPTTGPLGEFLTDLSSSWGIVVVFLLLTGSFGAYALAQRRGVDPAPAAAPSPDGSPDGAAEPSAAMSGTSDGDDGAGEDDEPAPELLSDEERVLRLLRDNDGRMKQGQIVKETNWSNAKVSQLLSKMNENDDVDKLRIGRENLITLPDEDVTEMD